MVRGFTGRRCVWPCPSTRQYSFPVRARRTRDWPRTTAAHHCIVLRNLDQRISKTSFLLLPPFISPIFHLQLLKRISRCSSPQRQAWSRHSSSSRRIARWLSSRWVQWKMQSKLLLIFIIMILGKTTTSESPSPSPLFEVLNMDFQLSPGVPFGLWHNDSLISEIPLDLKTAAAENDPKVTTILYFREYFACLLQWHPVFSVAVLPTPVRFHWLACANVAVWHLKFFQKFTKSKYFSWITHRWT